MGTTYRFLANPSEPSEVIAWYRALAPSPVEVQGRNGLWLYFKNEGPLIGGDNGEVDPKHSPVVSLFLPRVRRGVMWTVGEVHFLATPLRKRFPELHKVSSAFSKWLSANECVYSNKPSFKGEWNHFLEGSVMNYDAPVFAFPSGLAALRNGQYFVAEDDTVARLDKLCSSLRLRGIQCSQEA